MGLEYFKLLSFIRRRYLLERSRRAFGEEYDLDYHYDVEDVTDELTSEREGKKTRIEGVSPDKKQVMVDDNEDPIKNDMEFKEEDDEEEVAQEDRE